MSDYILKVESLGKKYRIRHQQKQQRYVSLRDVIASRVKGLGSSVLENSRHLISRNGNSNPRCLAPASSLQGSNSLFPAPNCELPAGASFTSDFRPPISEEFWALKDVSFEVKEGEVVGIIGRNGAGKSTLLKILSRITEPTEGRVRIRGRVASLLEVGTGFHPELTGRENIYVNGAILGMTRREISGKFDEIVAFAETEKFLDTPVKRYSSGMYVRLAFAVAAHLEPEILIVDEVLAVGDVAFQRKCLGKMGEVSQNGRTVLFVSHNMQAIRSLCKKAIWLQNGQVCGMGDSRTIVEDYLTANTRYENNGDLEKLIAALPPDPNFRLRHVALEQDGLPATTVLSSKPLEVVIQFSMLKETAGLHVCVELLDSEGTLLLESINNGDAEDLPVVHEGNYVCRLVFPAEFLAPRHYEVSIKASIANVRACLAEPIRIHFDVEASGKFNRAYPGYVTPGKLAPLLEWKTEFASRTVDSNHHVTFVRL
jgi:lipopolysaccharide transport system ATP-binding protein